MKRKSLFIAAMLMAVCFEPCHAQDVKELTEKVESLQEELQELRREYDYMYCKYGLDIIGLEVAELTLNLQETADDLGDALSGKNTAITYEDQKKSNELDKGVYKSYKSLYESRKEEVNAIALRSNFYEGEKKALRATEAHIESRLQKAKFYLEFIEKYTEALKGF